MENNETKITEAEASKGAVDTQETTIDYKAEYEKMKQLKDKYSKESVDWKNKYNATLSEVDKERIANEEREAHYKEIEREYNLGKLENGLSKSISDEKVVKNIANKMIDGDNIGAIEELSKYLKAHDDIVSKQVREGLLRDNPTPPPASGKGGVTREAFDKMSYQEKLNLYNTDRDTYNMFKN